MFYALILCASKMGKAFTAYFARLSRWSIPGELAFLAVAGVVGITSTAGFIQAIHAYLPEPTASEGAQGLVRPALKLGTFLLVLSFQYTERFRRFGTERARAEEAIQPMLDHAATKFSAIGDHKDASVRANIMLFKAARELAVRYHSTRMSGDADLKLRLHLHQGNAGRAAQYGTTFISSDPNGIDPTRFGLDSVQHALTKNLKTIVSIPVLVPKAAVPSTLAVLSVDSKEYYDRDAAAVKTTVADLETVAQAIAPLLKLTGAVRYTHTCTRVSSDGH